MGGLKEGTLYVVWSAVGNVIKLAEYDDDAPQKIGAHFHGLVADYVVSMEQQVILLMDELAAHAEPAVTPAPARARSRPVSAQPTAID